jgi:hypothetical protein
VVSNEELKTVWDTAHNIDQVKEKIVSISSGCGCKTGCTSKRCACFKKDPRAYCGQGCKCVECNNQYPPLDQSAQTEAAKPKVNDTNCNPISGIKEVNNPLQVGKTLQQNSDNLTGPFRSDFFF